MFKFLDKLELPCDRPAFMKMIDETQTISNVIDYTLQIDINKSKASIIKFEKEENEMSMLLEKRKEIQAKIDALNIKREADITAKLALYRAQLESAPESAEVLELRNILKAIDEIIAFDASLAPKTEPAIAVEIKEEAAPVEEVKEVIEEAKEEKIEEIAQEEKVEELKEEAIPAQETINNVAEIKIETPIVETIAIPAGEVVEESRPGMADIFSPERR